MSAPTSWFHAIGAIVVFATKASIHLVLRHREVTRRRLILRGASIRRGGRIDDRGWLTFEVEGTRVEVELDCSMLQLPSDQRIRWAATLQPPGTFAFIVSPWGVPSDARARADESLFDHEFKVEVASPDTFRRVWTGDQSKMMLDHFVGGTLTCTGTRLELTRLSGKYESPCPSPEYVDAGIDLLLTIARADGLGLAALRALPDAMHVPPVSTVVPIMGPGNIQFEVIPSSSHGHVTRACLLSELDLRERIEIVDGKIAAGALASLPPPAHAHARELGTADIARLGSIVAITWHGIEADPRRLVAAVDLLRALTGAPSLGAFR